MPLERTDENGIVKLTLRNPGRLNAIDEEIRTDLVTQLRDIRADPDPRCLIITGAGGQFCAGADISNSKSKRDIATSRRRIRHGAHSYIALINDLEIPVIAAVEGNAAGVGWSLALACDLILAADNARFTAAFGRIGLAPDGGLSWHLMRAAGIYAAKDIVLNARTIDAEEALRLHLVTRVIRQADFTAEITDQARALAEGPTFAMALAKKQMHFALSPQVSEFLEHEALMQPVLHTTEDSVEGPKAFREKRKPRFTGR